MIYIENNIFYFRIYNIQFSGVPRKQHFRYYTRYSSYHPPPDQGHIFRGFHLKSPFLFCLKLHFLSYNLDIDYKAHFPLLDHNN